MVVLIRGKSFLDFLIIGDIILKNIFSSKFGVGDIFYEYECLLLDIWKWIKELFVFVNVVVGYCVR